MVFLGTGHARRAETRSGCTATPSVERTCPRKLHRLRMNWTLGAENYSFCSSIAYINYQIKLRCSLMHWGVIEKHRGVFGQEVSLACLVDAEVRVDVRQRLQDATQKALCRRRTGRKFLETSPPFEVSETGRECSEPRVLVSNSHLKRILTWKKKSLQSKVGKIL